MVRFFSLIIILIGISILTESCKEERIPIPKERIYPKIEYPNRNYTKLDKNFCAFSFEYPDYMKFEQKDRFLTKDIAHPCWFNLHMDSSNFNGDIHFTYTKLDKDSIDISLHKMYKDAYRLSQEHNKKAAANEDLMISRSDANVYGVLFNIEGYVASPFQLLLTDSMNHAVRASLYFNSRPNPDSMAPVIDFVKTDIMGIVNSFEWENANINQPE